MANVLIVDDESITLTYLEEMLNNMGHQIAGKANTGPVALKKAKELLPDVVLMDISMPGEYDGIEAGRRIEKLLDIPVIFITAYSSEFYVEQIAKFGAYGYVVKPFEQTQVETAIYIALFRNRMEKQLKKMIIKNQEEIKRQIVIRNLLDMLNKTLDPFNDLKDMIRLITNSVQIDGIVIYQFKNSSIDKKMDVVKILEVTNLEKELPESVFSYEISDEEFEKLKKMNLVKDHSLFPDRVKESIKNNGIGSILMIPIKIEANYFGVMVFYFTSIKPFGMEIRNFFKIVTESIAIAFKRHFDLLRIQQMEDERRIHEKMLLRAEQLVSFSQLTSAIAHEIRQPLQSIKVLTDSVIFWDKENKKMSYEDLLQNFSKISARVDRIERIIKNMNLMVKSPDKIEIKPNDINRIIQDTVDFYKQKLYSHNIKLLLSLDKYLKDILISDIQFQQIVINLLNNSINALDTVDKTGKMIELLTLEGNSEVTFKIIDNGPGISNEIKRQIFVPFFSTNQKEEGMGMGLYVVQNILKCYNAKIEVSDNEGGGAVFTIKLSRNG